MLCALEGVICLQLFTFYPLNSPSKLTSACNFSSRGTTVPCLTEPECKVKEGT